MKWSVLTAQLRIRMVGTLYSSPLVKPLSKEPRNRIEKHYWPPIAYPNQLILTNLYKPSFFTSFFFFSKRNRISVAFKVTIPIFPDLPDLLGGWSEAGGNSLATLWKAGGAKLARKILFAFSRSLHHLSSNLLIWFSTAKSMIKLT